MTPQITFDFITLDHAHGNEYQMNNKVNNQVCKVEKKLLPPRKSFRCHSLSWLSLIFLNTRWTWRSRICIQWTCVCSYSGGSSSTEIRMWKTRMSFKPC